MRCAAGISTSPAGEKVICFQLSTRAISPASNSAPFQRTRVSVPGSPCATSTSPISEVKAAAGAPQSFPPTGSTP
jgi:hypothetical protein